MEGVTASAIESSLKKRAVTDNPLELVGELIATLCCFAGSAFLEDRLPS